jgi:hypothetical protein
MFIIMESAEHQSLAESILWHVDPLLGNDSKTNN